MKKTHSTLPLILLFIGFAISFTACNKSDVPKTDTFQVFLTDGPGDFQKVNIDIQKVEIKVDNDSMHKHDDRFGSNDSDNDDHLKNKDEFGEWIDLKFTPGIIDVLSLRNGVETKLGEAQIAKGTVRKIRITLGSNNSVVKDSVSYPLGLINPTNNYLYVKLFNEHRQKASSNDTKAWVDFDIAKSIVEVNGAYFLKPVLRPFCDINFAAAQGKVLPGGIKATISFSDGAGFNAIALPAPSGEFKIRGLKDGNYTITYAADGYITQTKTATVKKGELTKLAEVTLIK